MSFFERPSFRSGAIFEQKGSVPLLVPNKRINVFSLKRPDFIQPSPRPRITESIEPQDETIAEETSHILLTKVYDLDLPDELDIEWLVERQRLDNLGLKTQLPFGRSQRTIKKSFNLANQLSKIATNSNELKNQMSVLDTMISQGLQNTTSGQAVIGKMINNLLMSDAKQNILTLNEMQKIMSSVDKLKLSSKFKKSGFKHRFFSKSQFQADQAKITLFLLNKINKKKQIQTDVKQFIESHTLDEKTNTIKITRVGFNTLFTRLAIKHGGLEPKGVVPFLENKYIDLKKGIIVSFNIALQLVLKGVDQRKLNGFLVTPKPLLDTLPWLMSVGIMNPNYSLVLPKDKQHRGVDIRNLPSKLIDIPMFMTGPGVGTRLLKPGTSPPLP